MQVLNIHKRSLSVSKSEVAQLLSTLATNDDKVWPKEKWPAMKFSSNIGVGAKGGHGPIRYSIEIYDPNNIIQFRFSKPSGFNGIHKIEVLELNSTESEIVHIIDMTTRGKGTILWVFAIRSLHNALIEDAFDKMENHFSHKQKITKWNYWVRLLRKLVLK